MIAAAAGAIALCVALAAAPASAIEWMVDPDESTIHFVYTIDGRPAEGRFGDISGVGTFDPDRPAATRLTLRIAVVSLDLGDPLATAFALGPDWFDAGRHPEAVYRLARLSPLPDGRWEALGDLTIRDALKIIRTPVTLRLDAGNAFAEGEVMFDRRDFRVGFGPSALFVDIAPEVSVRFRINAHAAE